MELQTIMIYIEHFCSVCTLKMLSIQKKNNESGEAGKVSCSN